MQIYTYSETFAKRKILFHIEAKSDEKPQFTDVNEDFEEDFNEKMEEKMSFAKVSQGVFHNSPVENFHN